jgi:hypothetical protein
MLCTVLPCLILLFIYNTMTCQIIISEIFILIYIFHFLPLRTVLTPPVHDNDNNRNNNANNNNNNNNNNTFCSFIIVICHDFIR